MPKMIFHFIRNRSDYWILISGFSQPEILTNLTDWDSRYYQALTGDETEKIALLNEMKMERARHRGTGTAEDRLTWPKEMQPLEVTSSLFRFRQSAKSDLVQLAYGIPLPRSKNRSGGPTPFRWKPESRYSTITGDASTRPSTGSCWGIRRIPTSGTACSSTNSNSRSRFSRSSSRSTPASTGTEILNGWRQSVTSVDTVRRQARLQHAQDRVRHQADRILERTEPRGAAHGAQSHERGQTAGSALYLL